MSSVYTWSSASVCGRCGGGVAYSRGLAAGFVAPLGSVGDFVLIPSAEVDWSVLSGEESPLPSCSVDFPGLLVRFLCWRVLM